MAHEIDITDGIASFASARQDAWHRLGTVLPDAMTAEEALAAANLTGWNVRKLPLTAAETIINEHGVETVEVEVPDQYATVRTNPVNGSTDALGVVGAQYTPVQNEDHAEMLTNLAHATGAVFETAGALRGGREVFLTMKAPAHLKVGGIDPVDLYIAALNSHDGRSAFRFIVTPVRVVCANTQSVAEARAKSRYAMRHTRNIGSNLEVAREALELAVEDFSDLGAEAERMIQQELTNAEFDRIASRILLGSRADFKEEWTTREQRKVDDVRSLFRDSHTNTEIRGTRWAGYQAFTEYLDHYAPVHAKGGDVQDARAQRVILGGAETIRSQAHAAFTVPA